MNSKNIVFLIIILIILLIIWKNNNKLNIYQINSSIDQMEWIEKINKKYYPIGNDYFSIIHYPKYSSFFNQFECYKYFIAKLNNKIVATCCIAKLNFMWYICDLKSFKKGLNVTCNFGTHIFFNYVCTLKIIPSFFGIVMEPNNSINHIRTKYFFTKYDTLYLYQIKYNIYNKIKNMFDNIYPNHFFVNGYKKLLLKSTETFMNVFHIAQNIDSKYVKNLNSIDLNKYKNEQIEIMFCLSESTHLSNHIESLKLHDISPVSKMSVIGFNCSHINNWDFVKTYMI